MEDIEKQYWINLSKDTPLEPLNNRCKDCAITTGFYIKLAESLKKQPKYIQEKCSKTWFCHNSCKRACKGITEYLNTK
jgi:hypothetical protein